MSNLTANSMFTTNHSQSWGEPKFKVVLERNHNKDNTCKSSRVKGALAFIIIATVCVIFITMAVMKTFKETKQDTSQILKTATAANHFITASMSTKLSDNRHGQGTQDTTPNTTPNTTPWLQSVKEFSEDRISAMQEMMDTAVSPCQDFYQYACGNFDRYLLSRNLKKMKYITWPLLTSLRLQDALITAFKTQPQWESDRKAWQVFQACVHRNSFKNTAQIQQIVDEMGGFKVNLRYEMGGFKEWNLRWLGLLPPLANTLAKAHSFGNEALFTLSFKGVIPETERRAVVLQVSTKISPLKVANLFTAITMNNKVPDLNFASDVTWFAEQLESAVDLSSLAFLFELPKHPQTCSIEELASRYPNIGWQAFFSQLAKNINLGNDDFVMTNVTMSGFDQVRLDRLDNLLATYSKTESGRRAVHNYLVTKVLSNFDENSQTSSNTGRSGRYDALRRLEKRETLYATEDSTGDELGNPQAVCVSLTDHLLPVVMGSIVERIYPIGEDRRAKVASILTDMKSFISAAVNSSKYSPESKRKFLERMNSLQYQIGSPSWMQNQTAMNNYHQRFIADNSVIWNSINAFRFELGNDMKAIGKLGSETETPKSVFSEVAYISDSRKSPPKLTAMPLMLYSPVFDSALFNMATLGNVLAHELHHILAADVFSDDPFTAEKAKCCQNYFGKFRYNGMQFPSQKTYDEDLAEIASIKISYQFYKYLQENGNVTSLPMTGLTSDQAFFVAAAQAHCTSYTHEEMVKLLSLQDLEHSPGPYRINGTMANVEEFAKAFNCPLNSPMNPAKKCRAF